MAEEIKLIIEEQPYEENSGVVLTDVEEIVPEGENKNSSELLEQINHKLDLLLSIGGKE